MLTRVVLEPVCVSRQESIEHFLVIGLHGCAVLRCYSHHCLCGLGEVPGCDKDVQKPVHPAWGEDGQVEMSAGVLEAVFVVNTHGGGEVRVGLVYGDIVGWSGVLHGGVQRGYLEGSPDDVDFL